MITNLAAVIFFTITTNDWRTISITTPYIAPSQMTLAVYRPPIAHQVGNVRSNTVARIQWGGKTNDVILDSVIVGTVNRDVDANRLSSFR